MINGCWILATLDPCCDIPPLSLIQFHFPISPSLPLDLLQQTTLHRSPGSGFYAEIGLSYDAAIAQEKNGRPFGIENLREIQLSKRDVLDSLSNARVQFNTDD